jgi:hypothetical protein
MGERSWNCVSMEWKVKEVDIFNLCNCSLYWINVFMIKSNMIMCVYKCIIPLLVLLAKQRNRSIVFSN